MKPCPALSWLVKDWEVCLVQCVFKCADVAGCPVLPKQLVQVCRMLSVSGSHALHCCKQAQVWLLYILLQLTSIYELFCHRIIGKRGQYCSQLINLLLDTLNVSPGSGTCWTCVLSLLCC